MDHSLPLSPEEEDDSIAQLLGGLGRHLTGERVALGDVFHILQNRAFGLIILFFVLPSCVPMIPGVSFITGGAAALLSLQLAMGRVEPWLPAFVRDKTIARTDFDRLMARVVPWIARVENLSRPRLLMLTTPWASRILGGVMLFLALLLMLPIPVVGDIPCAVSIALLAFGLLSRDGVIVILGLIAGTIATILVSSVVAGVVFGVSSVF